MDEGRTARRYREPAKWTRTMGLRKLLSVEEDKFRDHLLRLDDESWRMRFGMGVKDSFIKAYAARIDDGDCIVYGYFIKGEMRAAAELRKLGDKWYPEAEAAFSVEKPFQNTGIGSELLGRILRSARNRGVTRLYMSCLAENARMRRIARKYDAILQFDYGQVVGELVPESPSYASLYGEAVDDGTGYVMAILETG